MKSLLLLLLAISPGFALAEPRYRVTELALPAGAPATSFSDVRAISDTGHVVGFTSIANFHESAATPIRWRPDGTVQTLPVLGRYYSYAVTTGVDNAGNVVGYSNGAGFEWTPGGGMLPLQNHESRGRRVRIGSSRACAITDAGIIVGSAGYRYGLQQLPTMWTPAGLPRLLERPLNSYSGSALSVNQSGIMVGWCHIEGVLGHQAARWGTDLRVTLLPPIHSNTYKHRYWTLARDINDYGYIVGFSTVGNGVPGYESQHPRAVAWTSEGLLELIGILPGALGSEAYAVNNHGQVVGKSGSELPASYDDHDRAFIWTRAEGIQDLNSLLDESGVRWTLIAARDINNEGQIVGLGLRDGLWRAFLATPL
jgi:probable HAF family extracellular repeat protein